MLVKSQQNLPSIPATRQLTTKETVVMAESFVERMHQEDVKNVVAAFKERQELLDKANEYGTLRANYAALEAATIRKIAQCGWSDSLGTAQAYQRKAAEWSAELSDSDFEEVVKTILGTSATIVTIWRSARSEQRKQDWAKSGYKYSQDTLKKYESCGRVNVTDYDSPSLRNMSFHDITSDGRELFLIQEAIEDNLRIKLRRKGAVGIGDGKYVDPKKYPEDIDAAITIRVKNITACILSLKELCEASQGKRSFNDEMKKALANAGITAPVNTEAE